MSSASATGMHMRVIAGEPVVQVAFLTEDIEAAVRTYAALLGVGPWFLRNPTTLKWQRYRGRDSTAVISNAFAFANGVQIELIQQRNDAESVFRPDMYGDRTSMHHFGVASADFDGTCRKFREAGYDLEFEAMVGLGARVAFFDTRDKLPAMVEVIEMLDGTRAFFEKVRAAAAAWDGVDPLVKDRS